MSLNAARKRRAGLADTGRCPGCGRYRMFCNGPLGCLGDDATDVGSARSAAELLRRGP